MTTAQHAVLIVDDEPRLRALLRTALSAAGYRVVEAETVRRAVIEAANHKPDLVVLDLGLPDGDGHDVVKAIRTWSPMPILVLSARIDDAQKIRALDAGADDYVTKPFSTPELLARLRVMLRRAASPNDVSKPLQLGDVSIDLVKRSAARGGAAIHFTPIEYRLLALLAKHHGAVVTQRQLLREVWGPEHIDDPHYLRVYMKQLRRKIEPDPALPRYLITDTGVGYRLLGGDPVD